MGFKSIVSLTTATLLAPSLVLANIAKVYTFDCNTKKIQVLPKKDGYCVWNMITMGGDHGTTEAAFMAVEFKRASCQPPAPEGDGYIHGTVFQSPPYNIGYDCKFNTANPSDQYVLVGLSSFSPTNSEFPFRECHYNKNNTIACTGPNGTR